MSKPGHLMVASHAVVVATVGYWKVPAWAVRDSADGAFWT